MKSAKEYWTERFGEEPKTDADKLAVAMMQEYAEAQRGGGGVVPTLQEIWDQFPNGCDVDKRVGANWVIEKLSTNR